LFHDLKKTSLIFFVLFYIVAGANHFLMTAFYLELIPDYVGRDYHKPIVYISGLIEIALAILTVFRTTRKWACIGIIIMLIAIFPANIYHFQSNLDQRNLTTIVTALRLPVQIVLIMWAWWLRKE